ncbi:MAG TPA: ROK family transcriptional regulator [Verrucomicrobiota bacterium]|nr:ROK family transcriptional regulator [Verrucomicrobiota bacterium]HOP97115.1 ROK family transcriptional regulator [Verrucomicrobiota bacterium]
MRKIDLNNFRVATSETARDINRRIVLNLIRKHQPISRADLSRQSGLQRSTVSAITEELIAERWVTEGAVGHLPRGRKPTFLHLNGERAGIIGINIRPTGTSLVLAALDTRFLMQDSMPTWKNPSKFVNELARRVQAMMRSNPEMAYEGIGVALPGRVDLETNRLVFAPNLGWDKVDLKTPLEQATGLRVELENAANACALAEFWSGRHPESVRHLIAVTISEGIGVGMILNGQIVKGSTGLAGEFGHVTLQEDGPVCTCGNRGCWEVCGSNVAAVRHYPEAVSRGRAGRPRTAPTFEDILRLAEEGEAKACEALDYVAGALGRGLAMLLTGMAPDVIVLIGEVTRAWNRVGPIVDRVIRERVRTGAEARIVPTDPDTQPRLRGTIALVLQKHLGAPLIA